VCPAWLLAASKVAEAAGCVGAISVISAAKIIQSLHSLQPSQPPATQQTILTNAYANNNNNTTTTMNDPGLNNLLKWGIQNSEASRTDAAVADQPPPKIDAEALQRLMTGMSGPSDAELMQQSMQVIRNKDAELEHRTTAFDNFEQLIENLDNANNIESLGLWMPLVEQLENEESELRFYAAWCCGTAVQNNMRTQERVRCPPHLNPMHIIAN